MPKSLELAISPDGSVRFIYDDETLAALEKVCKASGIEFKVEIRRASHVEPEGMTWVADMSPVNGPRLGPFKTRKEALEAEHSWLIQHDIPFPES